MITQSHRTEEPFKFSGNIFIFHAFDVGDDINFEQIKASGLVTVLPTVAPKYFKNYHIPLSIELPYPDNSPHCMSAKIHNFGAISLTYKIPFSDTLEQIRTNLDALDDQFKEQSIADIDTLYKKIKPFISKPYFFHTTSSYLIIQVDPDLNSFDSVQLKEKFGTLIASSLRFETQSLSEYQKNEILESPIGYYRGDLIVIDTEAAFVYDAEYEEILDFFEFANIQQLELRYFDRILDQQLNLIYEDRVRKVPLTAYLPFIGIGSHGPIDELGKLKVDISVITERLEGSIKLAGEPYYSELYAKLIDKLDLKGWQDTINKKLSIILDIRSVLQHKIDSIREDMLNVLIIILIFIELVVGLLHYLRPIT
jgi:hypothetical protein